MNNGDDDDDDDDDTAAGCQLRWYSGGTVASCVGSTNASGRPFTGCGDGGGCNCDCDIVAVVVFIIITIMVLGDQVISDQVIGVVVVVRTSKSAISDQGQ